MKKENWIVVVIIAIIAIAAFSNGNLKPFAVFTQIGTENIAISSVVLADGVETKVPLTMTDFGLTPSGQRPDPKNGVYGGTFKIDKPLRAGQILNIQIDTLTVQTADNDPTPKRPTVLVFVDNQIFGQIDLILRFGHFVGEKKITLPTTLAVGQHKLTLAITNYDYAYCIAGTKSTYDTYFAGKVRIKDRLPPGNPVTLQEYQQIQALVGTATCSRDYSGDMFSGFASLSENEVTFNIEAGKIEPPIITLPPSDRDGPGLPPPRLSLFDLIKQWIDKLINLLKSPLPI